ncbi:MAG: substrate-binding domain-containing protein [Treponema sp.]|jgi:ribose transport system substrate-binding protein|nr:substrate-binding domain-containing protein [Treponema sp.]
MKRKLFCVVVGVLVAVAAVWGSGQRQSAQSAVKTYKIGFSPYGLDQEFHRVIHDTIKAAVEAKGDVFVSADPVGDSGLQINQIEDMVAQQIDLLILGPISGDGILPALMACKDAGIPVLNYDAAVKDQDLVVSFVTSDNYLAGQLAGEYFVKNIAQSGKVIMFNNPDAESVNLRQRGFEDAVKGTGISIVYGVYNGDLIGKSEDMITGNPDAIGIFGTVSILSTVAYASLDARGLVGKMPIISVDGAPDEKAYIKSGGIVATAAQSPLGIANKAVEFAYKVLANESVPKTEQIKPFIIDKTNIDQYLNGWQ